MGREGVLFRFAAVYGLKDALKIQDVRTARLRNGSTLNNTDFSSYVCYVSRADTFRFLIYGLFVQIAGVLVFEKFHCISVGVVVECYPSVSSMFAFVDFFGRGIGINQISIV